MLFGGPISITFVPPSKTKLVIDLNLVLDHCTLISITTCARREMFQIKNRSVRQILPTDCLTGLNLIHHGINHQEHFITFIQYLVIAPNVLPPYRCPTKCQSTLPVGEKIRNSSQHLKIFF